MTADDVNKIIRGFADSLQGRSGTLKISTADVATGEHIVRCRACDQRNRKIIGRRDARCGKCGLPL